MIQRRKPLERSNKPIARSPIKRKPVDRSTWKPYIPAKRSKPRRGPLRSKPYRDWVRNTGTCPACRVMLERQKPQTVAEVFKLRAGFTRGHCDPAHTVNGGMSMKGPDSSCAPLCRGIGLPNHHEEFDAGKARFCAKYGLSMEHEAAKSWETFTALYGPG